MNKFITLTTHEGRPLHIQPSTIVAAEPDLDVTIIHVFGGLTWNVKESFEDIKKKIVDSEKWMHIDPNPKQHNI